MILSLPKLISSEIKVKTFGGVDDHAIGLEKYLNDLYKLERDNGLFEISIMHLTETETGYTLVYRIEEYEGQIKFNGIGSIL